MTQLKLVGYGGDSDMTDEDLTPLGDSTLSPPLLNAHINADTSYSEPAPAGVNLIGLSATKPNRTSNSTEPPDTLHLSQVDLAPDVNPPDVLHSPARHGKSLVAYQDQEASGSGSDSDATDDYSKPRHLHSPALLNNHTGHSYTSGGDRSSQALTDTTHTSNSLLEAPRKGVLHSVMFPPEPPGHCSPNLQDKVADALEKSLQQGPFNKSAEQGKDFRNPSIYEKMVEFCTINEYGTNYPSQLFDPVRWKNSGGYLSLRLLQKEAYERKQKARLQTEAAGRAKLEFVSAGAPKRTTQLEEVNGGEKKKKSKWDLSSNN